MVILEGEFVIHGLAEQAFVIGLTDSENSFGVVVEGRLLVVDEGLGLILLNLIADFEQLGVLEAGEGVALLGGFDELLGGFPCGTAFVDTDEDGRGHDHFLRCLGRGDVECETTAQAEGHPVG